MVKLSDEWPSSARRPAPRRARLDSLAPPAAEAEERTPEAVPRESVGGGPGTSGAGGDSPRREPGK